MFKTTLATFAAVACAETLVWSDEFDKLNFKTWQHEITASGGGNWEFEFYFNNRTNTFVEDGVLYMQPTLTSDMIGEDKMMTADLDLWGGSPADQCTSNDWYGCERNAQASGNVTPPIQSARLRSVNSFTLQYGRVEVRAQLPKGDWLWPAIWMLPAHNEYGKWPASGEIDIMESFGNDSSGCPTQGNNQFASTLHWGPNWDQNKYDLTHEVYTHSEPLSNDFHNYGLIWSEDRLQTYFDDPSNIILDVDFSEQSFWERGQFGDEQLNPWRGESNAAPFNREFFLIMNVAAGGTNGYFQDGVCGKPWSNTSNAAANEFWAARGAWYPTWNYPESHDAAMKIDYIRVYSADSADEYTQI